MPISIPTRLSCAVMRPSPRCWCAPWVHPTVPHCLTTSSTPFFSTAPRTRSSPTGKLRHYRRTPGRKARRRYRLLQSLRTLKKKRTKQEEFPKIDWKNLEDPLIQKAELIYSDRVNLHRDLLKLDRTLDESPTPETIAETVEKSIRNRLCFDELRSFNNTGRFLGRHPFVRTDDEMSRLRQLLLISPENFMNEYRNAGMNVYRYGAYLLRKGLSEEKTEKYRQLLEKWTDKERMMSECLKLNLYASEKRI